MLRSNAECLPLLEINEANACAKISSTHVQNSAQQHASNSTNALFDASAFQREQGQLTYWHTFPLMVVLTRSWFCFQGFAHKEL